MSGAAPILVTLSVLLAACTLPPARGHAPGAPVALASEPVVTQAPILVHVTSAGLAAKSTSELPALAISATAPTTVACNAADLHKPIGHYFGDAFTRGQVVLTFDDGPYVDRTPAVLDLLSEHRFDATFFVLGRNINRNTYAILQRMEAEGHIIASHSYNHDIDMARRHGDAVNYIRGQHEATRILIEIALLASSADDFEAHHARVFGTRSDERLSARSLRNRWRTFVERHQALLTEHGHHDGRYAVRYSRPPGGGPYLGRDEEPRARYGEALAGLEMLNVMWHSESGDVDATRARDVGFLFDNIIRGAQRGGVLLIHDYIRANALKRALDRIAADPLLAVIDIDEATKNKYGCAAATLVRRSH